MDREQQGTDKTFSSTTQGTEYNHSTHKRNHKQMNLQKYIHNELYFASTTTKSSSNTI
jgi:hypothetical protein